MTLQINSTTNQYITRTFSIEWQQKQTFALKLNSMGDRTQRGSPLKSAEGGAHVAHITAVPTENNTNNIDKNNSKVIFNSAPLTPTLWFISGTKPRL